METEEKRPRITISCIKCGLCVQMCPVQAISVKSGAFFIKRACIGCYACLETCPAGAVVIVKNEDPPAGPKLNF